MELNNGDDLGTKENFNDNERYCTVLESIIESFKEVKLMREGKLPKRSWKDFQNKNEESEDKDMETVLEERKQYSKLNMSRIKNRKIGIMSSEEALKDIVPIILNTDWIYSLCLNFHIKKPIIQI